METGRLPKLAPPPKKTMRFRRSISSFRFMDHALPATSPSPASPSSSTTTTATAARSPLTTLTASAIASSSNILTLPATGSRPRAKSAQSYYRDLNQPPKREVRTTTTTTTTTNSHSCNSSPQRGRNNNSSSSSSSSGPSTQVLFTGAIPQPMSYEMPPPPSSGRRSVSSSRVLSCYPSTSSLGAKFRQGLSAEINKKPLPPLPPSMRGTSPQRPSRAGTRSTTPIQQMQTVVPAITVEETGPRPETPVSINQNLPVELPVPDQLIDSPSINGPAELETPEPEYHVHATSRPDCALCEQQDQFWGFGLGIGLDLPLTPPATPPSPPAEVEREQPKLRFSMLKKMPQESRDITSWLALSPPISAGSSGFEDSFYDDDVEPDSAMSEFDYRASTVRFEQAQQLSFTSGRAALSAPRPRTARTLLNLPTPILANVFKSLDNHTDVYSLAATHSHFYDLLTMYKFDILVATTPPALATILANSSSTVPFLPPGQSIYDSLQYYTAALRHHLQTCTTTKSLIREHCQNFLSKRLLHPPTPADDADFTIALYNLWAFSLDFPTCRRNSAWEADVAAQAQWLRRQKLTLQQLKDVLEVYECIGALLCPLTDDLRAAVQADVIEVQPVRADMESALELWVLQLQTLELGRIISVLEMAGDAYSTEERWTEVKKRGLAQVRVGDNRRMWLKCAVGEVAKELQMLERRGKVARKMVWGLTNSIMGPVDRPRVFEREPSRLMEHKVV
ncbi:hypothetical protein EX30DRAFT_340590 [Ascodesmis nigricans]|uniref:F-box domain-containing protein n=1 Tax=Ascodesmis nigricans TaxID=341454 RepID=A0A4V3SIW1_9PEZI|nr:hypothetical protein EX30DRAFT_340590 [Ascodesmis nigricans]